MVDIQHEEAVEVAVREAAVTEHGALPRLRLVELPAGEDEGRQILLHLLRKGQQFLSVRLPLPGLLGSLPLHPLLLDKELLIV